jgi:hypothetical protein
VESENTTAGSEPYTMELIANVTAGLMDTVKIQMANVFGYPLGSFIPNNLQFTFQQMKPSLPLETLDNQMKVGFAWEATI